MGYTLKPLIACVAGPTILCLAGVSSSGRRKKENTLKTRLHDVSAHIPGPHLWAQRRCQRSREDPCELGLSVPAPAIMGGACLNLLCLQAVRTCMPHAVQYDTAPHRQSGEMPVL